ncbi:MAG: PmoA family protein [Chthoniobacteraceae bacterium]
MKTPLLSALITFTAASIFAADTSFSIGKDAAGGVTVKVGGKPFASYVIDQANKPYLWPVYGPTGKAMTRAFPMQEVESETKVQRDHPHHRGIVFGHESSGDASWKFPEKWDGITGEEKHTGGGDTWHERATFEEFMKEPKSALRGKQRLPMLARIAHREFTELKADDHKAVVASVCEYLDPAGKRFLTEERRLTFRVIGDMRAIDFDQDFVATDGDVHFDDRKDAGLSIRVPASMAVESKQGGQIITSTGVTDKDAWGKAAPWCDYHGPVEGEHLGIAFLNHPSSYRYPTGWHVRTYGLFTANPFAQHEYDKARPDGATPLKSGERLKLRHRFLFHTGDEKSAKIAEAFADYAKEKK